MAQVFVSYSRRDLSFVEQITADLKNAGFDVWYDISGIGGGSRWRSEIENALRKSQFVLVVLSPDSIASEWVEREFLFASHLKLKIIPLMYRPCELPLSYINLNYIDVQGENYHRKFPDLLRALTIGPQAVPLPVVNKPAFQWKITYFVSILVVMAMLSGGLLLSQWNRNWFALTSVPAVSETAATVPTLPPVTPSLALEPSQVPIAKTINSKGAQMLLVPDGMFTMGSNSGEPSEKPAHTVHLKMYYLDLYEVSNGLYQDCVDFGVCLPPDKHSSYSRTSYYGNTEFSNYPVVYVTWSMAKTYCEWRGARLPAEAEWEKALRGEGGDAPAGGVGEDQVNFCDRNCSLDWANQNYDDGYSDTAPVDAYPRSLSRYGFYNLPGNVWEWVQDWYSADYYQNSSEGNPPGPESGTYRVIRGGSYGDILDYTRISRRSKFDPAKSTSTLGFRCAMDVTP